MNNTAWRYSGKKVKFPRTSAWRQKASFASHGFKGVSKQKGSVCQTRGAGWRPGRVLWDPIIFKDFIYLNSTRYSLQHSDAPDECHSIAPEWPSPARTTDLTTGWGFLRRQPQFSESGVGMMTWVFWCQVAVFVLRHVATENWDLGTEEMMMMTSC